MSAVAPIWTRPGIPVPYPGLLQTAPTCVLVSIASAINWLTHSQLTELDVYRYFQATGHHEPTFATVLDGVRPRFPNVDATEYHDVEHPMPDVDGLLARVQAGAVLVLSLELASLNGGAVHRLGRYHMISVFNSGGGDAQVWDTNGKPGFLTWGEVRELLVGDSLAIPYPPLGYLVPHPQHHCLLLALRN